MAEQTETRKMKVGQLNRAETVSFLRVDGEADIYEFPFSSETPVDRWFGAEVLSHDAGCADLSRLNDGAPLLWNHNRDELIGVVVGARIGADKRGYCRVRFGTSPSAQQFKADVDAGVIRNVSFGYRILDMVESKSNGESTFTATRWAPLEVSLVSIPADPTVGIGRAGAEEGYSDVTVREVTTTTEVREEPKNMTTTPAVAAAPAAPVIDEAAVRNDAATAERTRIATIRSLAAQFPGNDELATQLVDGGRTIEDARAAFLERLGARQVAVGSAPESGVVDLTETEQRSYSVVRAITAAINKDWRDAGLELEVSRTLANELGRSTEGFFMPVNLSVRAPYAVGAAGTGGNIVATDLLAGSFIEMLRNKALMMTLGATTLTGLVGNVAIPRQITGASTYWVTENSDITESEGTFDQVSLTPKQIGARSQYSRLMLQQSTPDIEALVRADLAAAMALGIDKAIINGSGSSGQPRGVLNQSGIGSVAMGTNGAAFANSDPATAGSGIDPLIDLESKLDIANALNGSLRYVTNAKVVAALKKLKDKNGEYLWGNAAEDLQAGTVGMINGYGVARSNQVPSNLTKASGSNLSALLFGDWSQVLIGMWGGLEILPNPYGAGYNSGAVDIRAMQTADVNIRHAESFSAITDIVTS